jgi:hypothetical protein
MYYLARVTFPDKVEPGSGWDTRDENFKISADNQQQAEEVLDDHIGQEDYTFTMIQISSQIYRMLTCGSFSFKAN